MPRATASTRTRSARERITIIVDAYGPEEQATGWWVYLDERLHVPFRAGCVKWRAISPLEVGEQVEVMRMAPEEDCGGEMFVLVSWGGRTFGIPLGQLEGVGVDHETRQAIEDWHYWVPNPPPTGLLQERFGAPVRSSFDKLRTNGGGGFGWVRRGHQFG